MNTVSRPIKTASVCFLALLLLVAFLSDSVAQRRGGWGGSYYRSTPTYRPAPPRPMTPRYIQPSAPRMASMPRSPGGGPMTVRTMPRSITPTATVAKMPSYTGRVTFKGAPIIVSRTGKPFSIPQRGIFSTRVVSTFQYIRTTFTRYFVTGRVAILQTRIANYAKEAKLVTTKIAANDNNKGSGGGGSSGNSGGGGNQRGPSTLTDKFRLADSPFGQGRLAKSSEVKEWALKQGWTRSQTPNGPLKFVDKNGVERVVIKSGSSRTVGSEKPHIELKNESGQRVDIYGNPVSKRSSGNHAKIELD